MAMHLTLGVDFGSREILPVRAIKVLNATATTKIRDLVTGTVNKKSDLVVIGTVLWINVVPIG